MNRFQKIEIYLGRLFLVLVSMALAFFAVEWVTRKWLPRTTNLSDQFTNDAGSAFLGRIHVLHDAENRLADRLAALLRPVVKAAWKKPAPRHFLSPETDFAIEAQ